MSVRFITNSHDIYARWRYREALGSSPWAPPCGRGGIDCYGRDDQKRWRWVGIAPPQPDAEITRKLNLLPLDGKKREYRIYLPKDILIDTLSVGVNKGALLEQAPADMRIPIVYYGTSIVHGHHTHRPGTCHAAILQRRLDYPMLNLGFGGEAHMDASIAEFLSRIDAKLFMVDCLPNIGTRVRERMAAFTRTIRSRQTHAPILFIGDRLYGDASFIPERSRNWRANNDAQAEVFRQLQSEGIGNIHLLEGANFFGDDFDGAIDGSHPTDLGAWRMANALEPRVRHFLS